MSIISRRTLLQRLGLLLAAASTALVPGSAFAVAAATDPTAPTPMNLALFGKGWHVYAPDRARGELPRQGDRIGAHGILLDAMEGQEIGQFYSACFCPVIPGSSGRFAEISQEMHTFTLVDGSIMGVGVGGQAFGKASRFAIVGGTGRYAGVRGDYSMMQDPLELSGSGRAEFRFTFLR